jgi:Type II secretion system protein B
MSLILDALKRAERERQGSETNPAVSDAFIQDTDLPTTPNQRKYPVYVDIGIILALIIIALLIFIYIKKEPVSSAPAQIVANSNQINSTQAANKEATVNETLNKTENPSSAMRQAVTDLYQQKTTSLPKVEDVEVAQLYTEPQPVSVEVNNPLAVAPVSVAVTNPLADQSPQLPKNLQPFETRRIADVEDTIRFDDLSFNQKQLFPNISYSQHNYLGSSASSVVINGQLMRSGSRITPDLVIVEIVEDGIIFNYYNRQVSFKALNGWINM